MLKYYNNISLKNYNTFGIDAKASHFYLCENKQDIFEFLDNEIEKPLFIIGEGSNVLFTSDFEGTILKPELKGIKIVKEDDENVIIEVGAGENWDTFVEYCVENNFGGVENLSLIPGTVGSSPVQNIGAYGIEVKDVIQDVYAIDLATKREIHFDNKACEFKYRNSVFKNELKGKIIIYKVVFKLTKMHNYNIEYGMVKKNLEKFSEVNLKNIRQTIIDIRRSKLPEPEELGNAGSFFKNPIVNISILKQLQEQYPEIPHYTVDEDSVKLAAGWLIDQTNLKGYRNDDAGVHKKQALVLVNYGKATGNDILNLSQFVQEKVFEKFGINLAPEVNIL
jgi:UDP-N-acetylmuramate dehydrogenase